MAKSNNDTVIPVILAGGSGSRLWPMSRTLYPKQFLDITGDCSLLQNTLKRAAAVSDADSVVVCNENHRFLTAEQLREAGTKGSIILEPLAKNTAPAIALAALHCLSIDKDAIMLVLAADHVINDESAFRSAVNEATEMARDNGLVTFGVVPTRPETGYGYIKAEANGVSKVVSFEEKPNASTAESYLASGGYYWNSGMFVFKASVLLSELKAVAPEIAQATLAAYQNSTTDLDFVRVREQDFELCDNISIDHALMEKTDSAYVVPLDAGWSDIGSWDAVHAISNQDSNGNASSGDAIMLDCVDCYVNAESRLVATAGLNNIAVIETPDCVLVADNNHAQSTKIITNMLKSSGRTEADAHLKVFRPWGSYSTLNLGKRFQVKRITVLPGAKLSLQKHHHRAEHWIVVEGTAVVTCDDAEIMLTENQSTYIPLGATHRLENRGKIPLELIEVQSGSYLGEDDIVRMDDVYGRGESY